MSSRRRRVIGWMVAGALLAIMLFTGVVLLLTQTRWGNERVLALTLSLASRRLDGELAIQRLDGNILTGARVFGLSLRAPDGEPFLLADSAFVEYSLRTLAAGRIVLNRLEVYDPKVYLRRLPGERFWNYEVIFGDTAAPADPPGDRAPVLLEQVRIVNALVVVQLPWEPEEAGPAAREREIEEALAETSRLLVSRVTGREDEFVRSYLFRELDAEISQAVFAPDARGGNYLRVERLSGLAQIWREPARIERLEGELAQREGRIEFRVPRVLLPRSRLSLYGVVRTGEEIQYDVTVRGEQIALADVQWLYPLFPAEGRGEMLLTLESRPQGTLVVARDLDLELPGTRLTGGFGLLFGDTLRFLESSLDAAPLSIPSITGLLPTDVPVEGLRVGGAQIRAPAS
ncbi:MAG: hypothetical protein ACR2H9_15610 [Longimicrobiaceae bacterium]